MKTNSIAQPKSADYLDLRLASSALSRNFPAKVASAHGESRGALRLEALTDPESRESEIEHILTSLRPEQLDAHQLKSAINILRVSIAGADLSQIVAIGRRCLDCSGTGGSGAQHFNTSTAVAFVLAAQGVPVVKFGNRACTSASGSFDLLSQLGFPLAVEPGALPELIDETGLGLLYAPSFYPALARLAPIRKRLATKTLLNFIGPLLNPAQPGFRLMGISDERMHSVISQFLQHDERLQAAGLVTGSAGQDEIQHEGATCLTTITGGSPARSIIDAASIFAEIGMEPYQASADLHGDSPIAPPVSARIFLGIINGADQGSRFYRQVVLNAGAGLYIAGVRGTVSEGCRSALELLKDGSVREQVSICRRSYARFSS